MWLSPRQFPCPEHWSFWLLSPEVATTPLLLTLAVPRYSASKYTLPTGSPHPRRDRYHHCCQWQPPKAQQNQHTPRLIYPHLRSPSTSYAIISSTPRPCINLFTPTFTRILTPPPPCHSSSTPHHHQVAKCCSWSISDTPVCSVSRIPSVNNPLVAARTGHKLSSVSVRISPFSDTSVSAQTGHKLSGISIGLYHLFMLLISPHVVV